jgi:NAD(P)-dependent dehydrogenase (short-subunit alcohol dehydrogenase family)
MTNEPLVDFHGRKVLITGASSGLGRAIAVALGRHGAFTILLGRDETRLAKTAKALEPGLFKIVRYDLNDRAGILPMVKGLAQELGPLYGFCHSAGVVETQPLSSISAEALESLWRVNFLAGLEGARAVCRRDVMEEEGGSVLFVSSIYARIGMPGQTGYSATKGAVTAAARTMAVELARRNIRVNALSPGLVETDMIHKSFAKLSPERAEALKAEYPLGPGRPEDVARAAAFLLAPQSRWITGIDFVVDGGYIAK